MPELTPAGMRAPELKAPFRVKRGCAAQVRNRTAGLLSRSNDCNWSGDVERGVLGHLSPQKFYTITISFLQGRKFYKTLDKSTFKRHFLSG